MRCACCGTKVDRVDNFCRHCGVALNRPDLPTIVSRCMLPVPWTLARGPLLRGVAALVLGTAVELARRGIARRAAQPNVQPVATLLNSQELVTELKRSRFPWHRVRRGNYEISETVIQRRVRFFGR